ncbi:thymus-specific serine protease-like [Wyeomyia smithii]|uniref:thymus-specific serine protease-like n=1 Tax=Wyeomyia smithii TaxID=174621 RepID=UPI0024680207|nr:thymus-specific serine protease-like [Wyeomyia smithii]XP_055545769.1 thymus-specific serine protease-like [Wyeomyia smithii]
MRSIFLITLLVVITVAFATVPRRTRNAQASRQLAAQLFTRQFAGARKQASASSGFDSSSRQVSEHFFTTSVDHFNAQNTEQWTLRYFASTDNYRQGGPILIFLGGLNPIIPELIGETTLIHEMAREWNGALFAFESRFYGQSRLTEDVSTENLRLLSTDQILADLAAFVTYVKREHIGDETARVLVAGNELGGALAAWFRVRYPHLGHAAWASSAYMHAVLNFQDFSEAWAEALIEHGSQECYNEIFVAFHVLQNMIDLGRADLIYEKFNICTPIDPENTRQVQYFFSVLMATVEMVTIYSRNVTGFAQVCQDITGTDAETAVDAFASWFNTVYPEDSVCAGTDIAEVIEWLKETDWDFQYNAYGLRQALYQECTEFGFFVTTDSPSQPFGDRVTLDFYIDTCREVFGEWITEESIQRGIDRANNRFGGDNPGSSFTHFTNGDADPWRMISITRNLTLDARADVIRNQLGNSDLPAMSPDDPADLQEVKQRLKLKLASYLFPLTPLESPSGDRS